MKDPRSLVRSAFRRLSPAASAKTRRANKKPYSLETLEPRAMLSVSAYQGSGYVIAVSDQADDLYLQRRADGQLLIANNSSFDNADVTSTPDTLYITNGNSESLPGPIYRGDNRSVSEGGTGYNTDANLSSTTLFTFTISGGVNRDHTRTAGTLAYNGCTWTFDTSATPQFTQVSGPTSSVQPLFISVPTPELWGGPTGASFIAGRTVSIRWSSPVPNTPTISGDMPPQILNATNDPAAPGRLTNIPISPGYNYSASYVFDNGPSGGIIPGTLTGNLYFPEYNNSNVSQQGFKNSLRFTTSLTNGGQLLFNGNTAGTFGQYRVQGRINSDGTLTLNFTNAFEGTGGMGPPTPAIGTVPLQPVAVVAQLDPFLVYEEDATPSQATIFAGFDLTSQLWVDLLTPGSTFNIDSPVVVRTPAAGNDRADIQISATTININAQVTSQDQFIIQPSAGGSAITERLNVNASVAIPTRALISIANDPANDVPGQNQPGGPNRGQLFVSPSGSLSATLAPTPADVVSPTALVILEADTTDVVLEGTLYATNQSIYMKSPATDAELTPFYFTTKSLATDANTGLLRGATVSITLSNDAPSPQDGSIAFNVVDLATDVNSFRIRASSSNASPSSTFPYRLTIDERNSVSFDAVAASSLPITLTAAGNITFTSALLTDGDINIESSSNFSISAPLTSNFGKINLIGDSLAINNSLSVISPDIDARTNDITLTATAGDILLSGIISAQNNISIVQLDGPTGSGKVYGSAEVRADKLVITADGQIGDSSVAQSSPLFYLNTDVREFAAQAGAGIAIQEANDISIPSLRTVSGQVSLVANGVDPIAQGVAPVAGNNSLALLATMTDVTNLFVSTPNGSSDILVDTARPLVLGSLAAIRDQETDAAALTSMQAAGNVKIRSLAGPINVLDAPLAGGDALRARVATTSELIGTYTPGNGITTTSTLKGAGPGALPLIDGVQLRVNDSLLLKNQTSTAQNGIYIVKSLGGASTPWSLIRAPYADTSAELRNNAIVRVEEGTAIGSFYQLAIGAGEIGTAPIVANAVTLTTNIGSQLTTRTVTFNVASNGGRNDSAGSLGKMLALRQANDTSSSLLNPNQEMAFVVQPLPTPIVLTQELPAIETAFAIVGNGTFIDGSRIVTTREGNVVAAGDEVTGFEFLAGSGAVGIEPGATLSRFTVGGFTTGAAVKIDGASDILLDTLVIGRSETGDRLANLYGVQVLNAGSSATILNNVIVSSNDTGIFASGAASPLTVVGTTVGSTSQNNINGIQLANTGSVVIPPTLPANTVTGDFDSDGLVDYAYRDGTGIWQVVRTLPNGGTAAPQIWGHWSSGITWNDIVVGDFNGDGRDDIAGRSGNGAWWIAESTGTRFANHWAGVWSSSAGWQSVLVGDFNGDGLDDIIGRSAKNAWWGGLTTTATGSAQFQNRLMGIWSIAVNWGEGVVGDFNADGRDDIAAAANGATWWIGQSSGTAITAKRYGDTSPAATATQAGALIGNRLGVQSIDTLRFNATTTLDGTTLAIPADVSLDSLFLGQGVTGKGLSGGSRIAAIDASTRTITLTAPMTETGATSLTFVAGGRNFVQDNRAGIILSAGATAITNTTVANNTFSGIDISGGDYTIGLSTTRSLESNAIYRNGRWGINFAALVAPSNPQQDGRRIQGNYIGVTVNGSIAEPNDLGNIGQDGSTAPASLGFTPDATTGIDSFGNQQAIGSNNGGGGGDGGNRPNPPPVV